MNYSQEIRNAMTNIENNYDLETVSQVSLNLSYVNSIHKKILDAHSKDHNRSCFNKSFILPDCLQKRPFCLSEVMDESFSTDIGPEKRLKTLQKSSSCYEDNSNKYINNKIQNESLSQRSVKATRRKQKFITSKIQSPTETFLFYRGVRYFGIDFDQISTNYLPHRSIMEIKRFFIEQDRDNSLRFDQSLQLYRDDPVNLQMLVQEDKSVMLSTQDSSNGCSDCATLTNKQKEIKSSTKNLPSLDDVQNETAFQALEM